MKGLFLYTNIDLNKKTSGEAKKAEMQVDALRKLGLDINLIDVDRCNKFNKFLVRLPLLPIYNSKVISLLKENGITNMNFIYIRKYIIDKSFLILLKKIKDLNRNIKVILEIPTYPYDLEWGRLIDKPILIKERINRKMLYKYVDKIVTFSEDDIIFNISTIKINNGIDINRIKVKENIITKGRKTTINLLGVALLAKWHGYDRLISGLDTYYKAGNKTIVNFYIVGEGSELKYLQRCVKRYNLGDHVFFCGKMHGKALEEIYNKADIAIGSLGMYRIGMFNGYTLKLREYCAKCIPFIKAYNDKIFDDVSFRYMLNFPNDDTPINVEVIVDFLMNLLTEDDKSVIEYMRSFATDNLTWEKQMRQVVDYVKEDF